MSNDSGGDSCSRNTINAWLDAGPLWRDAVELFRAANAPVYLVGGSVRDALRGQPGGDMDVAVAGQAIRLGRWLADRLGAAFYPMDQDHDVARIVCRTPQGTCHIDLAGLRGKTIHDDLCARDFTVNAMGVALTNPLGPLLDPTHGRSDLAAGILRMAYPGALEDDPLRMLRAVRLSASLNLTMDAETRARILRQHALIEQVSPERLRDELVQILLLPSVQALQHALDLNLLAHVLPISSPGQAQDGLVWLASLDACLGDWAERHGPGGDTGSWTSHDEIPYQQELTEAWRRSFVEGRPRGILVKLAALLAAAGDPAQGPVGKRLRLSGREGSHLRRLVEASTDTLWTADTTLVRREAHRYYRRYGDAGVDGAVLAACRPSVSQPTRDRARYLLWAWFESHDEIVEPPPFFTGADLIDQFDLNPGPMIGHLLASLAEAQASGYVQSRAKAESFVRQSIAKLSEGK